MLHDSNVSVELTGKKEGERKARRRTKEDGESDDDDEDGAQQGNATQQLEDMSLEDPKVVKSIFSFQVATSDCLNAHFRVLQSLWRRGHLLLRALST